MAPLLFIGAAIGGAAMYFFDPDRGRRRRALVRDQAVRAQSNVRDMVDAGTRDLKNRGTVMLGRTRSLVTRRKPTDSVLAERVRSKMGRYVAHPGAIEVTAVDGEVTLKGSLFAHEHADLLDAVQGIAGCKARERRTLDIRDRSRASRNSRANRAAAARAPNSWTRTGRRVHGCSQAQAP